MPVGRSQTLDLYERIRADLLSLEFMPGETLTERGLERNFGASRTPARAALMRLETEGLVQRQGRGWIAAPIDLNEINSLAELRCAVESAGVRIAVERAEDADIVSLTELLDSAQPIVDEDQGVRAGSDFHVELARLSRNPFFVDAVNNAMTRLSRTRWLEVRTEDARHTAWCEHGAILHAVKDRNADLAASLIVSHIEGTNERLLTYLKSERKRLRGNGLAIIADARTA